MPPLRPFLAFTSLLVTACHTVDRRVSEHAAEFAGLDPATQQKIRAGVVEPGFTSDMVYMAFGKPAEVTTDASGLAVWIYRIQPVTAYNETILGGSFVKRVVYDPVKRTEDVIVEPIDTKAFPHKAPRTLRLVFQNGRLLTMERLNR